MKIISKFKDFYDFNSIYDSDDSIIWVRNSKYHYIYKNNLIFEDKIANRELIKIKNIGLRPNLIMKGTDNNRKKYLLLSMNNVIGIYPNIYSIPYILLVKDESSRWYDWDEADHVVIDSFFDTNRFRDESFYNEIINKYEDLNLKFHNIIGKGKSSKVDYEEPFLRINFNGFNVLEDRDIFKILDCPIFYYTKYCRDKSSLSNLYVKALALNGDFNDLKYFSVNPIRDIPIYNRCEEFLIEIGTKDIPEPDNSTKIEIAGFDKKTSFRNM